MTKRRAKQSFVPGAEGEGRQRQRFKSSLGSDEGGERGGMATGLILFVLSFLLNKSITI